MHPDAALRAVPADTTPEVWRRQMDALGAMTVQQRLALWEQLNEECEALEVAAIRRDHPSASQLEIGLELLRRRHGIVLTPDDLAKAKAR